MALDNIENKRKILEKFLEICADKVPSEEILEKSMQECQISPKTKELIFERGVLSILEFYVDEIIVKMQENVARQIGFDDFKIRDKVRFCLYNIFEQQEVQKKVTQNIRAFYLNYQNFCPKKGSQGPKPLALAFKNSAKISDAIWSAMGDKSTDFNYYTKRLTLSKIIIASFEVFAKESLEKTKHFIDQEIEKVMKFEKLKAQVKNYRQKSQEKIKNFLLDENGKILDTGSIIKKLPFIRLFY